MTVAVSPRPAGQSEAEPPLAPHRYFTEGTVFREMMVRTGIGGAVVSVVLLFAAVLSPVAWGTFPGQDGRIAFTSGGFPGTPLSLDTMNPDGSNVRHLTRGVGPAWSADGRRIVFVRSHRFKGDIYVMRADGSGVRRLTSTPNWADASPSFSPNGRRVVFCRLFQGPNPRPSQIVVMRLDDLTQRVLTTGAIAPEWAPNGRRIALVDQFHDNLSRIATIRPDGSHQRQLTSPPESDFDGSPAYASDGRTIYFDRFPWRGPVALMRMGAFGGQLQRVPTPTPTSGLLSPAPAPAGGCVVGTGSRGGSEDLLYARGGRCPAQGWLDQPADQPSWQPLPNG